MGERDYILAEKLTTNFFVLHSVDNHFVQLSSLETISNEVKF